MKEQERPNSGSRPENRNAETGNRQSDSGQKRHEHSNSKKASIVWHDESGTWYGLDNAATIMPALSDTVSTSLFRIEFKVDHEIDKTILTMALRRTGDRFPYFVVELRRGFFWYYLERHTQSLLVHPDSESPCQNYNINKRGNALIRIRSEGNCIAGEFSHALTDGSGGLRFMQTMVTEYFRLRGVKPGALLDEGEYSGIYRIDDPPHPEEYEDAYNRHFTKALPSPDRGVPAFQIPPPKLTQHRFRVISGSVPLEALLALAKSYRVSMTELLAAIYLDALQEIWLVAGKKAKKKWLLGVEIPVNMRKFYPTRSNRNFSLFVIVNQDMRLGKRNFDEIVERAHHQLRFENDERSIARQMTRNVGGSRNLAVRLVPLFIKDFFAHILFSVMGENLVSGFISNLGKVIMPPGPTAHIERIDFVPTPSPVTLTNAALLSWKDRVYINFGSLARSRELERLFFARMRRLGLPVRIDCNLPGGQ
ncbi:MAG: hypothetical protein Q8O15_00630 [Rectinemataceae bacterium]|nr:hypothetical protein [Rectinemataceae bacterium]